MTKLEWLTLDETQVTDVGLAHLMGTTGLQQILLRNTSVTGAGWARPSPTG